MIGPDRRKSIIERTVAAHQSVDEQFEKFSALCGSAANSPLFNDVFKALETALEITEEMCQSHGLVSWYIYENDYGKRGLKAAGANGRMKKITTIDHLCQIIEATL